jgi:hypothetical protein
VGKSVKFNLPSSDDDEAEGGGVEELHTGGEEM